ncbi:MAG: hypothetical protein BIFFINMI_03691 [Phycisphaerae bacterium]|nr:hypothetical protein [Phycisphaerae bacterium]
MNATSAIRFAVVTMLCLLAATASASAATVNGTWQTDGNGNWVDGFNWVGGNVAGGVDSTANFSGLNITADRTVTVDSGRIVGNMNFGDTTATGYGQNFILTGSTLTLDVTSGTPTIRSQVNLAGTGGVTVGVVLDGNDGLRMDQGAVILTRANIYTGGTTIEGARVVVGNNQAFSTGALSLAGGGWMHANSATFTPNNAVSLDGDFKFGLANASSNSGALKFNQQLLLNGNYKLIHEGSTNNTGAGGERYVAFLAGVSDGGNGHDLTIVGGTDGATGAFWIGSGSTYTGATIIHGANLRLSGTLATTSGVVVNRGGNLQAFGPRDGGGFNNSRLDDSVPVTLRGGTLSIASSYGSGTKDQDKETFGSVTLDYGHSTFQADGFRSITRMTIGNLVRNSGTAFFYRSGGGSSGAGGRIFLTGQSAGFIGGWAIARINETSGSVVTDYDFAWYDATSGVVPLLTNAGARPGTVWNAATGADVLANTTQFALDHNYAIRSLVITTGATNLDLAGHSLDITSGGLLHTAGTHTVTGGSLTSSGGHVYLYNAGGTLAVNSAVVGSGATLTTVGDMTLGGGSSFGGGLFVNSGTLTLTAANTFTGTAQVAPGAVLSIAASGDLADMLDLSLLFDGEEYGKVNLLADQTVNNLFLNGVAQAAGTYGATGSGATFINNSYFSGAKVLTVQAISVPEPATLALLAMGGLGLAGGALRRRGR